MSRAVEANLTGVTSYKNATSASEQPDSLNDHTVDSTSLRDRREWDGRSEMVWRCLEKHSF